MIIDHAYIERRMIPLNLFLKDATAAGDTDAIERATIEYGNAIKDLVAANIFPGDMLWKNFGMTRQGKVVFYDYDEIEYLSDCNFRHVPPPATMTRSASRTRSGSMSAPRMSSPRPSAPSCSAMRGCARPS